MKVKMILLMIKTRSDYIRQKKHLSLVGSKQTSSLYENEFTASSLSDVVFKGKGILANLVKTFKGVLK